MGNVRLYGSTSGYTELAPPAVAPDGVLSLPSGTGTLATQAYVDTAETDAINTAIAGGGLVHIATDSFSAVSSVSLNDVFTSSHENYFFLATIASSVTNPLINLRLRASGSDDTTSNYQRQELYAGSTTVAGVRASNSNKFNFGYVHSNGGICSMTFFRPQLAQKTGIMVQNDENLDRAYIYFANGGFSLTTQFDGFSIYPASGTITGTIRVYGYANS
jgi:hypothetical protein